ncbi:zinc finger X-chromosomal protein [Eurytemora carolleeae]|uniref:zinc finger X-chromosomal protein n=1 Tax=Eurytemora carolleeae TaxID=1294199 RepID=UPI000C78E68F|nr:zinc finger X-chromosomal protein [Eurytemora carolleeae]|eukprot:XP_023326996.1 zinc finger X-chromosomal protein-like [Eurytemora affinis]
MEFPTPAQYIDSNLVGMDSWELGTGFPEFMAGCLREVTLSRGMESAPLLIRRKVSHLSYLSHLYIRFNNIERLYDEYSGILKELSVFESVEEYDFEKMFDTAENKLLKDLKTMDPKRINQSKVEKVILNQEISYSCAICTKEFKNRTFLRKHMTIHEEETRIKEETAEDEIEEVEANMFTDIIEEEEEKILLEENIPAFTFTIEENSTQIFPCDVCGETLENPEDLDEHIKRHGNYQLIVIADKDSNSEIKNKGMKCDHCGLTVKSKHGLKIHMKTHLDLTCGVCGETSKTPRQLAGHMRVCHAPDGPEICALCGKSFKNLAFHTYKVHSGKIFTCDHCDFKSTLNCTIKKHIAQVHEGSTQTCDLCGKVVKELKHHKIRGCPFTKRKVRHQCDHCEKSFSLKDGLNRHIRAVHFKLKDKSCQHCNYRSAESFNLRMHIARVHEGRKVSLPCPFCNKNVVSLQWHLEQYHKDQDYSGFIAEESAKLMLQPDHGVLDPEEELKLLAGVTGDDLSLAASQLIFPLTNTL